MNKMKGECLISYYLMGNKKASIEKTCFLKIFPYIRI